MGDRKGGKDSTGSSLKQSTKNPGGSTAKAKLAAKVPPMSESAPMPGEGLYFDCGIALLSRQFDRDRERVITRAKEGGCCGMMVWLSDIEKQGTIADHCKSFSGSCYFATGIHPDNIDRTNKKSHEDWLEKVEDLARRAECVSILSGLNLSREVGTHFAQETLLKASARLAAKWKLPLVLHINNAVSLLRAIDILRNQGMLTSAFDQQDEDYDPVLQVLLHDAMTCCEGNVDHFNTASEAGFYSLIAATGLTDFSDEHAEERSRAQACVRAIPVKKLLLCTDSPWKTPQNLPDIYLRTQRNECSNITSIAAAVSEALGTDLIELATTIKNNTIKVLKLTGSIAVLTKAVRFLDLEGANAEPVSVESLPPPPHDRLERVETPALSVEEAIAAAKKAFYSCARCRCKLFSGLDVKTHAALSSAGAIVKTVFKVGEEGLCASTLLFSHEEDADNADSNENVVCIKGGNAECAECGHKLGKFTASEAHCACGAVVAGILSFYVL